MHSSSARDNDPPPTDIITRTFELMTYFPFGHWKHVKEMEEIDKLTQKNDREAADLEKRLAELHGTSSSSQIGADSSEAAREKDLVKLKHATKALDTIKTARTDYKKYSADTSFLFRGQCRNAFDTAVTSALEEFSQTGELK